MNMTTNNVTTPRPERKGLGEGQFPHSSKKGLGKGQFFLFISVLLLGLFTSCSDDEDKTEERRNAVIGMWEEEATTDSILRYAKCVITFNADGTMNGYTKFPENFRDTYKGDSILTYIDDEGYMVKSRGRWGLADKDYNYIVDEGYSFMKFGDWEWHPVGYTTTFTVRGTTLYLFRYDEADKQLYHQIYHKVN